MAKRSRGGEINSPIIREKNKNKPFGQINVVLLLVAKHIYIVRAVDSWSKSNSLRNKVTTFITSF